MRILFVVPYVPDLVHVRSYNLIRSLAARGHQVTVATLYTQAGDQQAAERLKQECAGLQAFRLTSARSMINCLSALPGPTPLQAIYCWEPTMAKWLQAQGGAQDRESKYDVIHIEHLRGAKYGLLFKDHRKARDGRTGANPPIIWDSVDCISHLFKQAVKQNSNPLSLLPLRFDLKRTQRYESYLLDQFDRTLVTSAIDKDALRSLYTGKENPNICVVPNGVDLDYFCLERHLQRSPVSLVATGKMSYHANIRMVLHLVHEIMPIVWASRPDVALVVAGKDPPREIRDLAANQSIQVTGTVPDIRPYLHRATMAVSPLVYGAGIQNKVLEAMACGTPVITTSRAISALSVVPGQDVLVADTPESFAEAILRLFGDPIRQELLSQAGRKYVEEYHNWDNIAMQLENIYCAAIDHKEVYEDDGSRTIHPDLQ